MGKFFKEFREFAMRGNVMDLAVGVIIGGAFGKIISSLVQDVVMPPLGVLLGGVNFADLKYTFAHAGPDGAHAALNYGLFIQNVVDFLIIALVVFLMVKAINKLKRKKPEPAAQTPEVQLLTEIRDILKKEGSR